MESVTFDVKNQLSVNTADVRNMDDVRNIICPKVWVNWVV